MSEIPEQEKLRLILPCTGTAYHRADGARVWILNGQTRIERYNPATKLIERIS